MNNQYTSTRDKALVKMPKEAILRGIAEDGGLYIYDQLDQIQLPLDEMMHMDYLGMANVVLQALLPDFSKEEIESCVQDAYLGKFENEAIVPLNCVNDTHILELFHGPTCAFKDIGLRMLPQLMSKSLASYEKGQIMILTATSGDTGKAALEGFKDVPNIGITVFYPENGVSNIQKLQMVTQEGSNTCVCAIKGNFDDAQSNVKTIFQNQELRKQLDKQKVKLSSANSINIGRLIPQVVYYFFAYKQMVDQGKITYGEQINFCVPTGNYGNVLAGYYAKLMGLPVHKFIVASNSNNVLYDFLKDGVYDRMRPFYKTSSPSMDILISSNLERLLYYKSRKDANYIKGLMTQLESQGKYTVSKEVFDAVKEDFYGGYCSDEQCAQAMKSFYDESGYVMDPHTAIGYKVMKDYERIDANHKCVLLSTASPYKFTPTVYAALFGNEALDEFTCMQALANNTNTAIPASLRVLKDKEIRHDKVVDKDEMIEFVKFSVEEILHD